MLTSSSLTGLETASDALAGDITRALTDADAAYSLRSLITERGDDGIGLGAVRLLGTDVLAPFVLHNRTISASDVEVVRAAVRAFPAPSPVPAPDPVWTARDWGLRRALTGLGIETGDWHELAVPAAPAADEPTAASKSAVRPVPAADTGPESWPQWSVSMARLSSLALPGLNGTVRVELATRRADAMRGMARSILRRDHLTAARLARWLCLDRDASTDGLLAAAREHLALLAPEPGRVSLELAIGARLMERGR